MSEFNVQFGEGRGIVVPLEIRGLEESVSSDRLYALLFALRVQILSAEEYAEADGIVQRLLVCEFDGGPLRLQRRRAIAAKVGSALIAPYLPVSPPVSGPSVAPAPATDAVEVERDLNAA